MTERDDNDPSTEYNREALAADDREWADIQLRTLSRQLVALVLAELGIHSSERAQ